MSEQVIEALRAGYEAFSRADWDGLFAQAHPDFELVTADRVINPGTYRGAGDIRRFFEDLFSPFEEVLVEPEEIIDRGDRIVVLLVTRSRPRGSTAVVENRIGHVWTIKDGQIVRLQIFPEREKALEAVEVESPQDGG
jgi:ketosteroid isomerase-like protein